MRLSATPVRTKTKDAKIAKIAKAANFFVISPPPSEPTKYAG
jgi:hypothetical protein